MRYNIPEPPLEPPVVKPDYVCDECGAELYNDEEVYKIDGKFCCRECMEEAVSALRADVIAEAMGYEYFRAKEIREELKL